MQLTDPITKLPRITKPQIAALKKLGLESIQDLLLYLPFKHLNFSHTAKIKNLVKDEPATIQVTITSIQSRFSFQGRMSLAEAIVKDDTGSLKVTWFNQGYLAKSLKKGDELFLSGTPEYYKSTLQLTNPIHEKVSDFPIHTSRLVPVYRLPSTLYPKTFRHFVAAALPAALGLSDDIPTDILKRNELPSLSDTVQWYHFPDSADHVAQAKKRLAFEEIFINQLAAQKHKLELAEKQAYKIPFDQSLIKSFVDSLPFSLTPGQKQAAWDILQDLENPTPMNRLLEADVGSGKTLVAFIAALQAIDHGLQVALLAPTEILARQHYASAQKYFPNTGARPSWKTRTEEPQMENKPKKSGRENQVHTALLTNHYSIVDGEEINKKNLLAFISEGMPGLYIGTHALIQEKVQFKNLALVIIDEQHRFGVKQRSLLIKNSGNVPHLLSLSATPIPRTLQLAFYGELDISQIKSKPAQRKPIITKLAGSEHRTKAYDFINKQIAAGRQAFVVTPLIEESDTLGVKAAKTEVQNLQKVFPHLTIRLMHGKLKGEEKEEVMGEFVTGKIHILVSTSVVEVGVDVPNASVMVIEAAERFGLAQLHQFRGRVGRAEHQSYCFLFTDKDQPEILQRLDAFTKTSDGFELAELDLKQRGFGELYGQQQSGWNFKYFSPAYAALIPLARQEAIQLLQNDPSLNRFSALKHKIKDKVIHFE